MSEAFVDRAKLVADLEAYLSTGDAALLAPYLLEIDDSVRSSAALMAMSKNPVTDFDMVCVQAKRYGLLTMDETDDFIWRDKQRIKG